MVYLVLSTIDSQWYNVSIMVQSPSYEFKGWVSEKDLLNWAVGAEAELKTYATEKEARDAFQRSQVSADRGMGKVCNRLYGAGKTSS